MLNAIWFLFCTSYIKYRDDCILYVFRLRDKITLNRFVYGILWIKREKQNDIVANTYLSYSLIEMKVKEEKKRKFKRRKEMQPMEQRDSDGWATKWKGKQKTKRTKMNVCVRLCFVCLVLRVIVSCFFYSYFTPQSISHFPFGYIIKFEPKTPVTVYFFWFGFFVLFLLLFYFYAFCAALFASQTLSFCRTIR